MQIMKYMFICIIIIFIFYMVSTTTCVAVSANSNVSEFAFLKGPLAQVQLCVLSLESLIELCLCHVKEVFDVGFMFITTFSKL